MAIELCSNRALDVACRLEKYHGGPCKFTGERPDAAPPKDRDALVDEGINILWKWMHEAEPGGPNRDQATAVGVITGEIARLRELLAAPPSDAAQPVAWTWTTIDRVTGSRRLDTACRMKCADAYYLSLGQS